MTDKQFQDLLKRAYLAGELHNTLIEQCELEYEKRFGFRPSDEDDDYFIDSVHYAQAFPSLEKIIENAKDIKGRAGKRFDKTQE